MRVQKGEFTGRHFLLIVLAAFATVVIANLTLAYFALGSFPGLNVTNSYVASQEFDAKKRAQDALGWKSTLSYENGRLSLRLTDARGVAVTPLHLAQPLTLRVGQATTARQDQQFSADFANGQFSAVVDLQAGNKIVFIEAIAADGTLFSQQHNLHLR
jgi:nitrogen fixation protein FixH